MSLKCYIVGSSEIRGFVPFLSVLLDGLKCGFSLLQAVVVSREGAFVAQTNTRFACAKKAIVLVERIGEIFACFSSLVFQKKKLLNEFTSRSKESYIFLGLLV